MRLRAGSAIDELLRKAAPLRGTVGNVWTDQHGERVSVIYEKAQIYACGWAAMDSVPAQTRADVPF